MVRHYNYDDDNNNDNENWSPGSAQSSRSSSGSSGGSWLGSERGSERGSGSRRVSRSPSLPATVPLSASSESIRRASSRKVSPLPATIPLSRKDSPAPTVPLSQSTMNFSLRRNSWRSESEMGSPQKIASPVVSISSMGGGKSYRVRDPKERCKTGWLKDRKDKTLCNPKKGGGGVQRRELEVLASILQPRRSPPVSPIIESAKKSPYRVLTADEKCRKGWTKNRKDKLLCKPSVPRKRAARRVSAGGKSHSPVRRSPKVSPSKSSAKNKTKWTVEQQRTIAKLRKNSRYRSVYLKNVDAKLEATRGKWPGYFEAMAVFEEAKRNAPLPRSTSLTKKRSPTPALSPQRAASPGRKSPYRVQNVTEKCRKGWTKDRKDKLLCNPSTPRKKGGKRASATRPPSPRRSSLSVAKRPALLEKAAALDIKGRTKMTVNALRAAIRNKKSAREHQAHGLAYLKALALFKPRQGPRLPPRKQNKISNAAKVQFAMRLGKDALAQQTLLRKKLIKQARRYGMKGASKMSLSELQDAIQARELPMEKRRALGAIEKARFYMEKYDGLTWPKEPTVKNTNENRRQEKISEKVHLAPKFQAFKIMVDECIIAAAALGENYRDRDGQPVVQNMRAVVHDEIRDSPRWARPTMKVLLNRLDGAIEQGNEAVRAVNARAARANVRAARR